MAFQNITDRNLSKGFSEILYYANEVTESWMSNMILIAVYIIVLITLYNYKRDFVEGMAVAGFFTFLIALFFYLGDFVSGTTFVFVIGVTIVSVVLLFFNKRKWLCPLYPLCPYLFKESSSP